MTTYPKTVAALEVYDKGAQEREALFDNATTDGDVYCALLMDKRAADRIRVAFADDTADRNSLENCMIVDLAWVRQLMRPLLATFREHIQVLFDDVGVV